jgi:hypothetical protein
MIEINEEKLQVKFKGVVYELDYPSVEMFEAMQEKAKVDPATVVKDLILACGMSEDVYKKLPAKSLDEIFSKLIEIKKN